MKKSLLFLLTVLFLMNSLHCAMDTAFRIRPVEGTVIVGYDPDGEVEDDTHVENWDKLEWSELVTATVSRKKTFIDTGHDGYANVEFYKSTSLVRLMPGTKLFIEHKSIYVYSGKSFFKIEKKSEGDLFIKTPTAIAGIRGTEFEVAVDKFGDKTDFSVYEGEIEVAAEKDLKTRSLKENSKLSVFDGMFKGMAQKFQALGHKRQFWNAGKWKQKLQDRIKKIQILKKFKKLNVLKPGQANQLFKRFKPSKIREFVSNKKLMNVVRSSGFTAGMMNWKKRMKSWSSGMKIAKTQRQKRRKTWWNGLKNKLQKNGKSWKQNIQLWKTRMDKNGLLNKFKNRFQKNGFFNQLNKLKNLKKGSRKGTGWMNKLKNLNKLKKLKKDSSEGTGWLKNLKDKLKQNRLEKKKIKKLKLKDKLKKSNKLKKWKNWW